jgi:hypothetical protein
MEPETYQHPKQPHAEKPLAVYPTDPNPPRNAAYWKRKTVEASMHIDALLRYAHYGTIPTEDDLAVIEARGFLAHLKR